MDTSTVPESVVPAPVPAPETTAKQSLPSVGTLFSASWNLFKKCWKKLILSMLVVIGPAIVVFGILFAIFVSGHETLGVILAIPLGLIGIYFMLWAFAAGIRIMSAATAGENLGVMAGFKTTRANVWSFIGAYFLYVGIVMGGTILLIVPGIIFAIWYSQSRYAVIAEGVGARESLKISRRYVNGHAWGVFGRYVLVGLVGIVFSLVLTFILGIIGAFSEAVASIIGNIYNLLWSTFVLVYGFELYRQLKAIAPAQQ